MFGQDNNQQQPQSFNGGMPQGAPVTSPTADSMSGNTNIPVDRPGFAGFSGPSSSPSLDGPVGTPVNFSTPELPSSGTPDPDPVQDLVDGDGKNDLLSLKQQALQHLSPLVSHLDQTPEEKFRTTMMMIQASDNKDLIKDAYEAAQKITDEKARAQALLDVINEINYFTQNNH